MPRHSEKSEKDDSIAQIDPASGIAEPIGDDEFLSALRSEIRRTGEAARSKVEENQAQRVDLIRGLLKDFWVIHNMFDEVGIHMTMEPAYTSFATFSEFPTKWNFKDGFDFASLTSMELKDRTPGWVGDSLRLWYYTTQEGKTHLRVIFEWCEGETYQRYSGWMRIITQVVLSDTPANEANLTHLRGVLKDVVIAWHAAHVNRDRDKFLSHLREKYPKGTTQAKSYS
jgi:hypothetical protein